MITATRPSKIIEASPVPVYGTPYPERICTSHVEGQNLNIRMAMRRFTRLTNGFSKKWENLKAALALYFAYYNFAGFIRASAALLRWKQESPGTVWTLRDLLSA
jgi:hypothetical protein